MLIVISPAKRLDWDARDVAMTEPEFLEDANRLARTMRNLTLGDLRGLMDLSDDLARLNRDRFRAWANGVARRNGYRVRIGGIGPVDADAGAPTQYAVFRRDPA